MKVDQPNVTLDNASDLGEIEEGSIEYDHSETSEKLPKKSSSTSSFIRV